jgi:hypothetical protein
LGIEHFGLARVSRTQFIQAVSSVIAVPVEPILVEVLVWSNKELAHFTNSQPPVSLLSIRNMSVTMIEAYWRLLFSALGLARPCINPSPT